MKKTRVGPQTRGSALMRDGSKILTHNNFVGRANLARIFADQTRDGPMRDGLVRFATPSSCHETNTHTKKLQIYSTTIYMI